MLHGQSIVKLMSELNRGRHGPIGTKPLLGTEMDPGFRELCELRRSTTQPTTRAFFC